MGNIEGEFVLVERRGVFGNLLELLVVLIFELIGILIGLFDGL